MDYKNIYLDLIKSRKQLSRNKISALYENHHIIPKSLGGKNIKDNLILLTPREHFIAHYLLTKIHTGKNKAKMCYALLRMCSNNPYQKRNITSRKFEIAKKLMSENCRGKNSSFYKKKFSIDVIEQIRKRQTGKTNSMYGKTPWNKGLKMPPMKKEFRDKISSANKKVIRTKEWNEKVRLSKIGKKQPIRNCPHCNKLGGLYSMLPYHFNNCKFKKF